MSSPFELYRKYDPSVQPQLLDLPPQPELSLGYYLEPSDLSGGITQKFLVSGYPDLLVRHEPDVPHQEMVAGLSAAFRMSAYHGIAVTPTVLIQHREKSYVISAMVTGKTLPELFTDGPNKVAAAAVDTLLGKLATYLQTEPTSTQPQPVALEVYAIEQYMLGTIARDKTPRVQLVDIPTQVTEDIAAFPSPLLHLAQGLLEAEQYTQSSLTVARTVLEGLLQHRASASVDPALLRTIGEAMHDPDGLAILEAAIEQ